MGWGKNPYLISSAYISWGSQQGDGGTQKYWDYRGGLGDREWIDLEGSEVDRNTANNGFT